MQKIGLSGQKILFEWLGKECDTCAQLWSQGECLGSSPWFVLLAQGEPHDQRGWDVLQKMVIASRWESFQVLVVSSGHDCWQYRLKQSLEQGVTCNVLVMGEALSSKFAELMGEVWDQEKKSEWVDYGYGKVCYTHGLLDMIDQIALKRDVWMAIKKMQPLLP